MDSKIRFALPSKGRLSEGAFSFLEKCGMRVNRPNSRQYIASLSGHPSVEVILQRPADIVTGVRQNSLHLGITGYDIFMEYNYEEPEKAIVLHDELGFAKCSLHVAVPNTLEQVNTIFDLYRYAQELDNPLRVATKFKHLTKQFLEKHNIRHELIKAEGTLEIAPKLGYADIIVDLVSSGVTLRENGLRRIQSGEILKAQACLIGSRKFLQENQAGREFAQHLLEYIDAYLRGKNSYTIVANVRGESAEAIANKLFEYNSLTGLRGPTIAPIYTPNSEQWFSVSLAVKQAEMQDTIRALRQIGGSGVIVTPATYIFEEEPVRYRQMLTGLGL